MLYHINPEKTIHTLFVEQINHSTFKNQANYHPNWNVIDKYIDEGITGTQAKKRPSFLRMIEDAKSGKFNLTLMSWGGFCA
ncbi:MAG: recombinase family protein [Ruminococcus sp.]|nr:recombinase family protein [Ruminococcus sp.]